MPLVQGSKRRFQATEEETPESPEASPEPQTQRRRTQTGSDDEDYGRAGAAIQGGDVEEMGRKLVRLALACEYQRKPIRRQDINDKVLGTHTRQFKSVFASAQTHLRAIFGMEMFVLPAREKITTAQKRAAAKSQSQPKATTTSWMLISILPSEYRNPEIIQPPSAPTSEDESKYTAIYTILVSLILLSGGSLNDAKMEQYLRRLGLEDNTPVQDYDKTEKLMKRLEKDGYIIKIRESTGTGEDDIYWVVGPRGKVEVNEQSIRGLAATVYGDMETEEEQTELDRKIERSLGTAARAQPEQNGEQPPAPKRQKKSRRSRHDQEDDEDEDEDDDDD